MDPSFNVLSKGPSVSTVTYPASMEQGRGTLANNTGFRHGPGLDWNLQSVVPQASALPIEPTRLLVKFI